MQHRIPQVSITEILAHLSAEEEVELGQFLFGRGVKRSIDLPIIFLHGKPPITDKPHRLVFL